jgi:hypothetical protein
MRLVWGAALEHQQLVASQRVGQRAARSVDARDPQHLERQAGGVQRALHGQALRAALVQRSGQRALVDPRLGTLGRAVHAGGGSVEQDLQRARRRVGQGLRQRVRGLIGGRRRQVDDGLHALQGAAEGVGAVGAHDPRLCAQRGEL